MTDNHAIDRENVAPQAPALRPELDMMSLLSDLPPMEVRSSEEGASELLPPIYLNGQGGLYWA